MSQEALERLREASVRVFGNRYRAELMLALASADGRGVCLGDLAMAREVPASVYQAPVRALVEAGLVRKLPRVAGERRRWYRRSDDDALWQCLEGLLSCLAQAPVSMRVG
ncbi:ArsR family transcriptional regulator [Streptomyces sp. SID7499]|uniref:ArsR family transcriptional regulator n=1 Tax=Streptomyces sp. SID7499 TaxID=2706086 RepID=A0A6G3XYY7_9ACTN|nr:ArsR family transcriptional regulator [Streptomyces sp. SID7499]